MKRNASLTVRLAKLAEIPGTSHEFAALLRRRHRIVYATLCNLRREGRVAVVGHKRSDAKRGPAPRLWGLPKP